MAMVVWLVGLVAAAAAAAAVIVRLLVLVLELVLEVPCMYMYSLQYVINVLADFRDLSISDQFSL